MAWLDDEEPAGAERGHEQRIGESLERWDVEEHVVVPVSLLLEPGRERGRAQEVLLLAAPDRAGNDRQAPLAPGRVRRVAGIGGQRGEVATVRRQPRGE